MPSVSKSQQRLFGMAYAYNKGELPGASKEVKQLANSLKKKDLKDFASTKHKGLPEHVKKKKKKKTKKSEILNNLVKIANLLDKNAHTDLADELDNIIKELYSKQT